LAADECRLAIADWRLPTGDCRMANGEHMTTCIISIGVWMCSAPPEPAVTALAIARDGAVWVGSAAGVKRWAGDGSERVLEVGMEQVAALAVSGDGKRLAAAGGVAGDSGAVEVFEVAGGKRFLRIAGHADVVHDVAWSPDGSLLATASADRTVRLWNASDGKPMATLEGHSGPVLAAAISPDGKLLCTAGVDQTIRVWELPSGKLMRTFTNHLGTVHALAFRPGVEAGRPAYLASASEDGTVRIWQPGIGRMVRIQKTGFATLTLAWSGDGSRLAAAGKGGTLTVFDGDDGSPVAQHKVDDARVNAVAVGADGVIVYGGSTGRVQSAATGKSTDTRGRGGR